MSLLSKVVTGKIEKPHYVLLYGEPGIGKTTWASQSPSPIFLCSEDGADEVGVSRVKLNSFQELLNVCEELIKADHNYKTIVLDTVDHFEHLIFQDVCKDKGKVSIEDIGYAKGYIFALDYWEKLAKTLERARDVKNMNIILLAHATIKAHNDPQLDAPFDTYQIKLHHKAAEYLRDRVSCVLFSTYQTFLHKEKNEKKGRAYGDGSRIIYTEKRPAFVAKNRYNLPFELPMNWDDFANACKNQKPRDIDSMIKFITENINSLDQTIRQKAIEHFENNKTNPATLAQIEDRIKAIISTKTA